MAAGVMPSKDQFDLTDTPCVLCSEPIKEGERYFQRDGWNLLGHMTCVMERPDEWDSMPDRSGLWRDADGVVRQHIA